MIWIAKLTFVGVISRSLLGPMILCLDGEVVWSNLNHYRLNHPPLNQQRFSAFTENRKQKTENRLYGFKAIFLGGQLCSNSTARSS